MLNFFPKSVKYFEIIKFWGRKNEMSTQFTFLKQNAGES